MKEFESLLACASVSKEKEKKKEKKTPMKNTA